MKPHSAAHAADQERQIHSEALAWASQNHIRSAIRRAYDSLEESVSNDVVVLGFLLSGRLEKLLRKRNIEVQVSLERGLETRAGICLLNQAQLLDCLQSEMQPA